MPELVLSVPEVKVSPAQRFDCVSGVCGLCAGVPEIFATPRACARMCVRMRVRV